MKGNRIYVFRVESKKWKKIIIGSLYHFKRVHVMTEASEKFKHEVIKPISVYSVLRPGSS